MLTKSDRNRCKSSTNWSSNNSYQLPFILIALFHVDLVNVVYQSPLILTELFQHSLINVSYLTACCLYKVMMTLHFFMTSLMTFNQNKNQKLRHNR